MPSLMLIEGEKAELVYMCIDQLHVSAVKALEPLCRRQTCIFCVTFCKNCVSKYSAVLSPLGGGFDFVVAAGAPGPCCGELQMHSR